MINTTDENQEDAGVPREWKWMAYGVVLFYVAMCVPIVLYAPKLIGETTVNVNPPSGSASQIAQDLDHYYFHSRNKTVLLLLVKSESSLTTDPEPLQNYTKLLQNKILTCNVITPVPEILFEGYYVSNTSRFLRPQFLSSNHKSTIISIIILGKKQSHINNKYIKYIRNNLLNPEEAGFPKGVSLWFTGEEVLNMDGQEGTVKDIERMELICVPFAFMIFCYFLKSAKLLLAPILSILISIGSAFALSYPFALITSFFTITPSVMLSLDLALSIDYNLFILIRFNQASTIKSGLQEIRDYTSRTILVSGVLISIAIFGLMIVPCQPIRSTGLGAGITVLCTMLVNLTLTPAILCIFGKWFKKPIISKSAYEAIETRFPRFPTHLFKASRKPNSSIWGRVGKSISKYPYTAIVVVLLLGAPFYCRIPELDMSGIDQFELLPRDAASVKALKVFQEDFPPGRVQSYTILITNSSTPDDLPISNDTEIVTTSSGLYSEAGFDLFGEVAATVCETNPGFSNNSFLAAMFVPFLNQTLYLSYEESVVFTGQSDYRDFLASWVSQPHHRAGQMDITTPFDPLGHEATKWIKNLRNHLTAINEKYKADGIEVMLYSGNVPLVDFAHQVNDSLPEMLGVVVSLVVIIVFVQFKSVMIPLRLAFTLLYTLAVVFGFVFYVYQTDAFHWLFPYLHNYDGDALQWLVPSLAITIIIGLGLDYDVYLLTRVVEIRTKELYSDKFAIVEGLHRTGSVISGAGIIMAVAFSGLILSDVVVLNQFGVCLCVSVLLDTFVIRTILLPAVMLVAGKWNWWPTKMPMSYALINYEDHEDYTAPPEKEVRNEAL
eukprot:TRINITY_DN1717_c1_g2_i1.p1 TRINITY_DN1717_c1_g2~~TRINITY_DN1717_c1_g2_i1.p1  ORF type:complete len:861 (+),score=138.63 TRINITY_DN1717_c1_g2_i1:80-2584(+)